MAANGRTKQLAACLHLNGRAVQSMCEPVERSNNGA